MELFRCRKCGSIYGQKESECLKCGHKDFIIFKARRYGMFTYDDDDEVFDPNYGIEKEEGIFKRVCCGKVYEDDERLYTI